MLEIKVYKSAVAAEKLPKLLGSGEIANIREREIAKTQWKLGKQRYFYEGLPWPSCCGALVLRIGTEHGEINNLINFIEATAILTNKNLFLFYLENPRLAWYADLKKNFIYLGRKLFLYCKEVKEVPLLEKPIVKLDRFIGLTHLKELPIAFYHINSFNSSMRHVGEFPVAVFTTLAEYERNKFEPGVLKDGLALLGAVPNPIHGGNPFYLYGHRINQPKLTKKT